MVPCRLYEQVYHSFVVTEQERGLKDLRQPTKIVIWTEAVASCCKAYDEYRLHVSSMQVVEVDEDQDSSFYTKIWMLRVRSSDLHMKITQASLPKVSLKA